MNIGETGSRGEAMVAAFMRKNGCKIIKRNYHCRFGEIDIIAEKSEYIIFTEVKTRSEDSLFSPAEAIDERKRRRILLTAESFMQKHGSHLQPRFDVAEVTVSEGEDKKPAYRLNYIKNAF